MHQNDSVQPGKAQLEHTENAALNITPFTLENYVLAKQTGGRRGLGNVKEAEEMLTLLRLTDSNHQTI